MKYNVIKSINKITIIIYKNFNNLYIINRFIQEFDLKLHNCYNYNENFEEFLLDILTIPLKRNILQKINFIKQISVIWLFK